MRFLLAFLFLGTAHAHELQPGFLELTEKDAGRYQVFWKQPPSGGAPLRLTPVFPATCQQAAEARGAAEAGAWLYRTTIQCEPALAGQTIAIEGLEAFPTDVLVRVQHASGTVETHLLKPEQPSITLGSGVTPLTYVVLGIEHIALGVDHLLFVLGLLLIVRSRWVLVKTITAFTVSHSIALAAATFSVVSVPSAPLNAAIALSILFLGPEIVRTWRGESSFTIRHPWAVAFLFGLLHGFGFASGLTGLGLPRVPQWAEPVWHLYVVRTEKRADLIANLDKAGIGSLIHYPIPPHLQAAYADLGLGKGAFPLAEALAETVLSLPMGAHMPETGIDEVAAVIRATLR